jgi:uncharacterized membrane protein YeaQ/YmgE (transglycosylase-associated protein family)
MSVDTLIIMLIVGAVAGWAAGLIVKGYGFGLIGNIVVGILGAVVAGWLLPRLGVHISVGGAPIISQIITAFIGAVILLFILGLVRR